METEPDYENMPGTVEYERKLKRERADRADEAILAELIALPVLADDPHFVDDTPDPLKNYPDWHNLSLLWALAEIAAERKLVEAVPLILERACFGDPGEGMRGLRHPLERIVNPEWDILTDICLKTAQSVNKGARLWSIAELGILRDKKALSVLINALNDPQKWIVQWAGSSLNMLCRDNADCQNAAIEAIEAALKQQKDAYTIKRLQADAERIRKLMKVT